MTDSTQVGLLAPPTMGLIVFALGWNIERTSVGAVSRRKLKLLVAYAAALTIAGYIIVWSNEIKAVWASNTLLFSLAALGVVAALVSLMLFVHEKSDGDQALLPKEYPFAEPVSRARRNIARRIFAWAVIIWGLAGLIGGIVAIISHSSSR